MAGAKSLSAWPLSAGITERMMAAGGGATWGEVGDLWVLDAFMPSLPAN